MMKNLQSITSPNRLLHVRQSKEKQKAQAAALQSAYRYALSLTHHRQDAEDLVQQAWLKCHRKMGANESLSLLFTAIRNLFYDQCRRGKIIPFVPLEAGQTGTDSGRVQHPAGRDMDVEQLLGSLRPEEREALYLHVVEGFTAREISEGTGTPRNTVLSLIHRARKRLRAQFQEGEGTHDA